MTSTVDAPEEILWHPEDSSRTPAVEIFRAWLSAEQNIQLDDHEAMLRWSVQELSEFWSSVWDYFGLPGQGHVALPGYDGGDVYGAEWFPGATLNHAEVMLTMPGRAESDMAIFGRSDSRADLTWSVQELRELVASLRQGLLNRGVSSGDRVAAYLPNVPETIALFLATASIGAVFTSCAPEFGTQSVIDRWRQINPKVIVAIDGYLYGSKRIERHTEVRTIVDALDSVETLVVMPYLPDAEPVPGADLAWDELAVTPGPLDFESVPFDHPLYVLFSSGTTGLPKAIVHGHGGITLEHLKALAFNNDVQSGDRVFWQTTTSWMMWNLTISALGLGAAVVVSDVNPVHPDIGALWQLAKDSGITHFGTSPGFLQLCRRSGFSPREHVDTSKILQLGVTGTACAPDLALWACAAVSDHVRFSAGSGGTDICSGFVGDSAVQPVYAGRMASTYLGVAAVAYDQEGKPVVGEPGELVITAPMPSMPVGFWGDVDGARYRAAYFDEFPGVWRHGDWITFWANGSCAISGRSDATLNRDGVRLGTAEFYEVLDVLDGVEDSLVVHVESTPGEGGRLLLFVAPSSGPEVSDALLGEIRHAIKSQLSPRHLPDEIHAISEVPRNLTGKKLEVPVKRILEGAPLADVAVAGALQNPDSFSEFVALAHQS